MSQSPAYRDNSPLAPSMINTTEIEPTRKTLLPQHSCKYYQTTVQQRLCSLWWLITTPLGLDYSDYLITIPTSRTPSWQPHSELHTPSCTTHLVETAPAWPTTPPTWTATEEQKKIVVYTATSRHITLIVVKSSGKTRTTMSRKWRQRNPRNARIPPL